MSLTRQEKLDAQAAFAADKGCPDCGGLHQRACNRIKRQVWIGQTPALGLADTGTNRLYFVGQGTAPTARPRPAPPPPDSGDVLRRRGDERVRAELGRHPQS